MNQKNKRRVTPLRIVGMIFASLLPVCLLLLCGIMLLGGAILNLSLACCFMVLPLLVIVLSGLNIFSRQGTPAKWGIMLVIYIIAVPLFLFGTFVGRFELVQPASGDELKQVYADIRNDDLFMHPFLPTLEEIGEPDDVTLYEYFATQAVFFTQDVYTLVARYEPAEYALQTQAIEANYSFYTELQGYGEHFCEPEADMDGYRFRMIDAPEVSFPKLLGFIATNDDTCEIVYMSFQDYDLDWIDDLPEFLNEYCGWEHIR